MKLKVFAGLALFFMIFFITTVETADGADIYPMDSSSTGQGVIQIAQALDPPCPPEDRIYGFPPRDPDFDFQANDPAFGIPGRVVGNCCQSPGPDGLYCCDTRDCGWFDCDDAEIWQRKTYQ